METLLENWPVVTSFLSGATALLAVIFGPIVQMRIARCQQRSSVVSSNRIRWIEDFRREVAEFIAACHLHESEKYHHDEAKKADDKARVEHYRKALDASFFRVNTLLHLLRLKIDPESSERTMDAEIWAVIKRIDELDVRDFNGEIKSARG